MNSIQLISSGDAFLYRRAYIRTKHRALGNVFTLHKLDAESTDKIMIFSLFFPTPVFSSQEIYVT